MKPKICAVSIAKNEEKTLRHFIPNVQCLADKVVIVDTGGDDKTLEFAEYLGAETHQIKWEDNFAKARNKAVELAGPADWYVMLDCDELIEKPAVLRNILINMPENVNGVRITNYCTQGGGIMDRQVIWREGHGRWFYRAHNHLIIEGQIVNIPCKISHNRPIGRRYVQSKYIEAMRLDAEEFPERPSRQYYYARQLMLHGRIDESLDYFQRCAKISRWPEEKAMAITFCGLMEESRDNKKQAKKYYYDAIEITDKLRDPYIGLVRTVNERSKAKYAKRALKIGQLERNFFDVNPVCYSDQVENWLKEIVSISE